MLLFLSSVVEQLDVALEHLKKRDVHNARFSMMLTDNVVELILHQIAKDAKKRQQWVTDVDYPHEKALADALKRSFEDKIKFAKLTNVTTEEIGASLKILHEYRNELYHVGLQQETILQDLSEFYFDLACDFASKYNPESISWGSGMKLPERSKQYFKGRGSFPGSLKEYHDACISMKTKLGYDCKSLIKSLANHTDSIVSQQDTCLGIVAEGAYNDQKTTRNQAILDSQAWKVIFTNEGKKFAQDNGFPGGGILDAIQWIGDNYKFRFNRDPIPSWQKQAQSLRSEKNPHKALNRYNSFVTSTQEIREIIYDSAGAVEEASMHRLIGQEVAKAIDFEVSKRLKYRKALISNVWQMFCKCFARNPTARKKELRLLVTPS
jgi:hypothetical protein